MSWISRLGGTFRRKDLRDIYRISTDREGSVLDISISGPSGSRDFMYLVSAVKQALQGKGEGHVCEHTDRDHQRYRIRVPETGMRGLDPEELEGRVVGLMDGHLDRTMEGWKSRLGMIHRYTGEFSRPVEVEFVHLEGDDSDQRRICEDVSGYMNSLKS